MSNVPISSVRKYLSIAIILLACFISLAIVVSPKINSQGSSFSFSSPIIQGDASAFEQINEPRYKPLDGLMVLLTLYGREVVWTVTGILLFIFGGWAGRKTVIIMGIAMLALIPIGTIAKEAVARPRPIIAQDDFMIAPDKEFAFPSGHTMIVSAGAAVMLAIYRDTYKKLALSIGLTIEAALVSLSRVYVGGHYPLDVVGGILLGVGIAFIFVAASKKIDPLLQPIAKISKR